MGESTGQRTVTLVLHRQPDGGLRVHSPDLPGLALSGRNPDEVVVDIGPAIQELLEDRGEWPVWVAAETEPTLLPFVANALSASQVGTWEYDIPAGRMCGDPTMARLFGHAPEVAEAGLPFDEFCRGCAAAGARSGTTPS